MAGRPQSTKFSELNFELLKDNNKKAYALCNVCKKTLHNTALSRLNAHRKKCHDLVDSNLDISHITEEDTNDLEVGQIITIEDECTDLFIKDVQATPSLKSASLQSLNLEESSKTTKSFYASSSSLLSKSSLGLSSSSSLLQKSSLGLGSSSSSSSLLYPNSPATSSSPSESSSSKKNKKRKQTNEIKSYIDSMSKTELARIETSIAKFFFGCNIPLRKIESTHFHDMVKALRPAYEQNIPNRKILVSRLLNEVYEDCLQQSRSILPKNSVLLIDGWKNSSNNTKTVVSMIHNTTSFGESIGSFVDAWDCTGESETGEKLCSIVNESEAIAKNLYDTKIYAVVSDNASPMLRMGKNLQDVLWHNTCNSHIANLLAKDVTNKNTIENVNMILKEFKNSDLEKAILDFGGRRMKLACETRWCSNRDACQSLLMNLQHMKQIIINEKPKKVKSSISKLVFDDNFVDDVKKEKDLLDPICEIINVCQKKETSIADSARLWLNFDNIPINNLARFEKRSKMALTKYALTAYYLHPFYDNSVLEPHHIEIINEFLLSNLNAEGLEDWCHFKSKSGIFATLYDKGITKSSVFWATAEIKHKNLASLAMKLLNIPASSAQIERLFSNWGQVHTSPRNRLSFENSKKLVHVYFCLNNKNVLDDYEDE